MLKQKSKPFHLIWKVAVLLLLVCCQNDDRLTREANEANDNYTKVISLEEFKTDNAAYAKAQRLLGNGNNKGKGVYSAAYGFTVNTDKIYKTKKDGYNFYCFVVYPDTDKGYLENLYLHPLSDGTYIAFLIQYNFTDSDFEDFNAGKPLTNLKNKVLYTRLDDFGTGTVLPPPPSGISSWVMDCDIVVTITATQVDNYEGNLVGADGNTPGTYTEYTYSYSLENCVFIFSTTIDIPSGGGAPGDGGNGNGSGGNPFNPVKNLDPVKPVITIPGMDEKSNVTHLKNLVKNNSNGNKTAVKGKIDELRSRLATDFMEDGAMFDANQNILLPSSKGANFTKWFGYPIGVYYVKLHMHQNQFYNTSKPNIPLEATSPVESDSDIFNFLKMYKDSNNSKATDLFVSRLGTFAMMVNDKNKALNAFSILSTNVEEKKKFIDDYDENIMNTTDDNERLDGFIKFINETIVEGNNLGVSLYRAVYDGNEIIDWIKL